MEQICTIVTKDKREYKVELELLRQYSTLFSVMLEDNITDQFELDQISSSAFDYVYEFLQLHKTTPPQPVAKPVLKKVNLRTVMSDQDAQLMQRINTLSTDLKVQILNSAMYLQMESFKKLLIYAMMQKQLQDTQNLTTSTNDEVQKEIRKQIQQRVNSLIEMENHRKRLEAQNFQQDFQQQ